MTARPLFPPAHARAMSVLLSSSSGVGTYGGLNICTGGDWLDPLHCWDQASPVIVHLRTPTRQPATYLECAAASLRGVGSPLKQLHALQPTVQTSHRHRKQIS